jgi:flagellar hook-basal body complex protein FliE
MAIDGVSGLGSLDPRAIYGQQSTVKPRSSFGEQLHRAIAEVDQLQAQRDGMVEEMVRGEQIEVHEIMTVAEEAQLAFELMLEVRNKLLESYQEIMRMQV